MAERGEVRAVAWVQQGSELAAAAGIGALSLTLNNAVDFDEDGGMVDINGLRYEYDTIDPDSAIMTLSSALTVAAAVDDRVLVISGGQIAIDYVAFVSLGDGDEVEVPVPYGERDLWVEGEYADPVIVDLSDDLEAIEDVPGRTPLRDAAFINASTLPPPTLTDLLPPASSPTATVIGGIGALFVRWPAIVNHDAVTYEVHLSKTPGFVTSTSTKAGETSGTAMTLRTMPDGSALTYVESDGVTETIYVAKIIAKDVDGPAAAGTEGSGSMQQVTGPDVAATYVYAGTLVADQIQGGSINADITISARLKTAETGQRVEIDSTGVRLVAPDNTTVLVSLPTDPTLPATLKGYAELDQTTINGNFTMRGTTNSLASASSLQLQGKLQNPPTPPTASLGWQNNTTYQSTISGGMTTYGWTWHTPTSRWVTGVFFSSLSLLITNVDGTLAGQPQMPERSGTHYFHAWGGVVYLPSASAFYALGTFTSDADGLDYWELRKYTLNVSDPMNGVGTLVASSLIGQVGSAYPDKRPVIGLDATGGTGLMLASYNGLGQLFTQTVDATSLARGAQTQIGLINPLGTRYDLGYVERQSFDYGATRTVIAHRSGSNQKFYAISGTARSANDDFPTAVVTGLVAGAAYGPDGVFHSLDLTGRHYTYSTIMWTTQSATWWGGYTWYDSDATGGTHESGLSAKATFTMQKRAQLTLTSPTIPDTGLTDDPDTAHFFIGRGAAAPADAAMFANGTATSPGRSVTLSTVSFAGTTPPANNFPGSVPSKIVDAVGNTLLDSEGASILTPTGAITMYGGAAAPTGWLICDGSAISRTVYASLFTVIGTTFGTGDTTTTFNLPDMRTRLPLGVGALAARGQTELGIPGSIVGTPPTESTSRSDRWSHSHSHTTGTTGSAHTHNIAGQAADTPRQSGTGTANAANDGAFVGHAHGGDTGSTGSGHTHSVSTDSAVTSGTVHAYTALNYIIRF